jgi:hypothetical protein
MRPAPLILAATLLLGGCGIAPTDVIERAPAPVIEIPPPSKTIYLLKDGELTLEPADVGSASVESLLRALFAACPSTARRTPSTPSSATRSSCPGPPRSPCT